MKRTGCLEFVSSEVTSSVLLVVNLFLLKFLENNVKFYGTIPVVTWKKAAFSA
jgi:hypothetical protein